MISNERLFLKEISDIKYDILLMQEWAVSQERFNSWAAEFLKLEPEVPVFSLARISVP